MRNIAVAVCIVVGLSLSATSPVAAIVVSLGRADIERALALARWPSTDEDRARFHARYVVHAPHSAAQPVYLDTVEVFTEFRRMELIAEQHARLNDLFARGGAIREAEEALEPWRGRVSIVAHVLVAPSVVRAPEVQAALIGPDTPRPIATHRTPVIWSSSDGSSGLEGVDVESVFAPATIGQTVRMLEVWLRDTLLGRVVIDFRAVD